MRKADRLATAGYLALCFAGLLVHGPALATHRSPQCHNCSDHAGLWIAFGVAIIGVALFGILCAWLLAGLAKPITFDSAGTVVVITLYSIGSLLVLATPALFLRDSTAIAYGILCVINAGLFLPMLNFAQELDQPPLRDPRRLHDDDAPGYSSLV